MAFSHLKEGDKGKTLLHNSMVVNSPIERGSMCKMAYTCVLSHNLPDLSAGTLSQHLIALVSGIWGIKETWGRAHMAEVAWEK